MSNLLEEFEEVNKGLTITFNPKDIKELWIRQDPSWVDHGCPEWICKANITFEKQNITSKVTLYAQIFPEILKKVQDFLLSL